MAAAAPALVLAGEKVHMADGHFNDDASGLLNKLILEVGAETVLDRRIATIVLTNPASPADAGEKEKVASLLKSAIGPAPINVPYHWLTLCHHLKARVDISSKSQERPIFIKDAQPIRAWVSLNVMRKHQENPVVAHAVVVDLLVRGGALIVKQRRQADILVIDPTTSFFHTVQQERERNRRTHQQLAERDWVEDCFRNKKLALIVETKAKQEVKKDEKGEESFGEEEMAPKRAPGRVTGQDYTPGEDDFMLRYLAAHFPHGSWGSRKTYETLVSHKRMYPTAANHSPQSWHERFKKNSAVYSKRVTKFIEAGVDGTLKTEEEREREAVARAEDAARAEGGAQPAPSVQQEQPEASASSSTHAPPASQDPRKVQRREAAAAGPSTSATSAVFSASEGPETVKRSKRTLVDPDSDTEAGAAVRAAPHQSAPGVEVVVPARPTSATNAGPVPASAAAQRVSPNPSQPAVPSQSSAPTSQPIAPIPPRSTTPIRFRPAAPIPTPATSGPSHLQGDSIIVNQSLGLDEDVVMVQANQSAPPSETDRASQGAGESQASINSNSSDLMAAGAETQAILSDFSRIQAIAQARVAAEPSQPASLDAQEQATQAPRPPPSSAPEAIRAESSTQARATSLPRSPKPRNQHASPPAKRPRHTEPIQQVGFPAQSDMPAPRSVARFPRVSHAADGSGKQRISVPVELQFRVLGVTQDGSTEEEGEEDVRPRRNRLSANGEVSTPRLHRDRLQKRMSSSVLGSGSSRRQSRQSGSSHRHQSPDTVYASPAIPPRPPIAPSESSSVAARSARRRASPSPITERERQRAVLDGQQVAQAQAEMYLNNIRRLRDKYGVAPVELSNALDSTMQPGEVSLPAWDEIERRLDGFYNYAG